jgi:hypothetical protein
LIDFNHVAQKFFSIPSPKAKPFWEREYNAITRHTQKKSPGDLIKKRRPSESQEVYDYRIENFEHLTHGTFNRAIERLQEIITESSAKVVASDELENYIQTIKIDNLNIWQWLNSKVVRRMIDDSNGYIIWWPKGEGVVNPSQKVEVEPVLLLSKNVKHFSNFISWKSNETNPIQLGNGEMYAGEVYYLADDTYYYKYVQTQAAGVSKYELRIHYQHNLGELPIILLGGDEISEGEGDDEKLFLTSYFAGAVPFANEVMKNYSDHQASVITSAHAIREMEATECNHKGCEGGKIREASVGVANWKTCPSCKGSGFAVPATPYGVLIRPKKQSINGEEVSRMDALKYHTIDPANLEYQEKHWRNYLADTEKALNLLRVEDAQSGVAKEIDREGIKAMIDKIGFNFYNNIVKRSYEIIGKLRFVNQVQDVSLVLPETFRPKTESELAEELSTFKEKGSPDLIVIGAADKFIKKRFSGDKKLLKISDFLIIKDPLFIYNTDEKNMMLSNGSVDILEAKISTKAVSIMMKIASIMGNQAFIEASYEQLEAKFDAETAKIVANSDLTFGFDET